MTRTEQLRFCNVCKHQKFDLQQGIICGKTNRIADFHGQCEMFEGNQALQQQAAIKKRWAGDIACKEKRFVNFLIDSIVLYIFTFMIARFLVVLAVVYPFLELLIYSNNKTIGYLITLIAGMIYYTGIEFATGGRSIGKYITKTKVVDRNGNQPDSGTFALRSLCRFIPFDAFSFLGTTGWHDKLSNTEVVEIENK